MKPKTKNSKTRHLVVELGNVGLRWPFERKAHKTIRIAKKRPTTRIVGIDLRKPNRWFSLFKTRFPKNVEQKNADFLEGLKGLEDNSVSRISSDMAIGHYNAGGKSYLGSKKHFESTLRYTAEVFRTARQKLKDNSKIVVTVDADNLALVERAFREAGFSEKEISKKMLRKSLKRGSYWKKAFQLSGDRIYRVIAVKKAD